MGGEGVYRRVDHGGGRVLTKTRGSELVFALGDQSAHVVDSFGAAGVHHSGIDSLNAAVVAALPEVGSVLVKGSRFMKMERVVAAITATQQQKQASEENTMPVTSIAVAGGARC